MATLQDTLRFLTTTAKIPLATALSLSKPLHAANISPATLPSTPLTDLTALLKDLDPEEKYSKQIHAASKRKKRSATASTASPNKRHKTPQSTVSLEDGEVGLPTPKKDEEQIRQTVIRTNRAPLLLAFATVLLSYTHPAQPVDSQLSLGMAVVSAGAKAKGLDLGVLDSKRVDAAESLGKGHRSIRITSREVAVLRRERATHRSSTDASDVSVDARKTVKKGEEGGSGQEEEEADGVDEASTQETIGREEPRNKESEDWLWGLDLDALAENKSGLPIHKASSALSYLRRSFPSSTTATSTNATSPSVAANKSCPKSNKSKAAAAIEEKEHNLALLLGSLELLFDSWSGVLGKSELDRRTWNWYTRVRPEVEQGRQGWGGRGDVRLEDILKLRRPED
ncbi:MAG: hypothetical protein Q9159_005821 [Coniocarpon cinnabarinum]